MATMAATRKKAIALLTTAAGLGILLVAVVLVFLCRPLREERYWLSRLREGDESEKERAADRLAELKSEKAIPILVQQHPILLWEQWRAQNRPADTEEDFVLGLLDYWTRLVLNDSVKRPYSVQALARMGQMAIPHLKTALRPENPESVRTFAAFTLGEIGAPAKETIPDLQSAIAAEDASRPPGIVFVYVASYVIAKLNPEADIPDGSPAWREQNPGLPDPERSDQ